MARFDLHLRLGLILPAIGLAFAVPAAAAEPSRLSTQQGAEFVCHGVATQTCHFAIIPETGARTDFALTSGQTRRLSNIAVGVDRYMVSVNFPPPESPSACSRVPVAGKRSAWCKLSAVAAQDND
jgi:hypothetical protein